MTTPRTPGTRSVCFLTGTRADFGKMKPLIRAVTDAPDFEARIFATGMHLLARYGATVTEIRRSGFDDVYTFINQDGDGTGMDLVLANTIAGFGLYVREFQPDLIVVHGDRVEALAGATVGALHNILVAHVEGGEVSGTVDELVRHAVSKMSHLHFVSNVDARRRLLQMGEREEAVRVIGSPNIDVMLGGELPSLDEVRARYAIPFADYAILVFHPVTTERGSLREQADAVTEAAKASGVNFVVVFPNNDEGTRDVMASIARLEGNPRFRLLPSMRFEYYLALLREARFILGNSSSGIHEAPVYGVPTVNVGTRQQNRFRHESIVNVPAEAGAIEAAIRRLPARYAPTTHFGTGDSAAAFLSSLRDEALWATPAQKVFRDAEVAVER